MSSMMHDLTCIGEQCPEEYCPNRKFSQVDHAWATIPSEVRGWTATHTAPSPAPRAAARGALRAVWDIAAWTVYSVVVLTLFAALGAWVAVRLLG